MSHLYVTASRSAGLSSFERNDYMGRTLARSLGCRQVCIYLVKAYLRTVRILQLCICTYVGHSRRFSGARLVATIKKFETYDTYVLLATMYRLRTARTGVQYWMDGSLRGSHLTLLSIYYIRIAVVV
jgi:hypothetical protein